MGGAIWLQTCFELIKIRVKQEPTPALGILNKFWINSGRIEGRDGVPIKNHTLHLFWDLDLLGS